jgi:hypothetical protein
MVFRINDPDRAVVGRPTVELLLPPGEAGEREAVFLLLHVIWVEVLPQTPWSCFSPVLQPTLAK